MVTIFDFANEMRVITRCHFYASPLLKDKQYVVFDFTISDSKSGSYDIFKNVEGQFSREKLKAIKTRFCHLNSMHQIHPQSLHSFRPHLFPLSILIRTKNEIAMDCFKMHAGVQVLSLAKCVSGILKISSAVVKITPT